MIVFFLFIATLIIIGQILKKTNPKSWKAQINTKQEELQSGFIPIINQFKRNYLACQKFDTNCTPNMYRV